MGGGKIEFTAKEEDASAVIGYCATHAFCSDPL